MNQQAWESAMGMRGYSGSPAERYDRAAGLKVGGQCWWLVEPGPLKATITDIRMDEDGDPWFSLTFNGGHKDVEVEREEIAELQRYPTPTHPPRRRVGGQGR